MELLVRDEGLFWVQFVRSDPDWNEKWGDPPLPFEPGTRHIVRLELPTDEGLGWTFSAIDDRFNTLDDPRAVVISPCSPGWLLLIELARNPAEGDVEERSLVFHRDPRATADRALSTDQIWKRLRIGEIRKRYRDELRRRSGEFALIPRPWRESAMRARPGSRGRADLEWALWAADYVQALAEDERAPYPDLSAKWQCSVSAARSRVRRTRQEGFLTETGRGQPGGSLTAKANALLRAAGVER